MEWTGSNYFPYKHKLLLGPSNIKPTLFTFTAITIIVALFMSFESKVINCFIIDYSYSYLILIVFNSAMVNRNPNHCSYTLFNHNCLINDSCLLRSRYNAKKANKAK